jgi:outer membrane receptor for ferrienterochelin and colicins
MKYQTQMGQKKQALLTQRFAYARGFRAPSLKEMYFFFVDLNHNIQGNPELKAERSHHLHYALSVKRQYGNQLYQYEVSTFYNHINQQIALSQSSAVAFSYFNLEQFKSTGVQLQTDIIHPKWRVGGGLSVIGRSNQLAEAHAMNTFYWSPEARAQLQYNWLEQALSVSLFYKFNGALPSFFELEDGSLSQQITEAYHIVDFSITKTLLNKQLNLSSGIKNLLNVTDINGLQAGAAHTATATSTPVATGRLFFLSVQYKFSK